MLFILHFANTNICTTQIYHVASDSQDAEQWIIQITFVKLIVNTVTNTTDIYDGVRDVSRSTSDLA